MTQTAPRGPRPQIRPGVGERGGYAVGIDSGGCTICARLQLLGGALTLGLVINACTSYEVVDRWRAPNGEYDAVLVESNGGATTAFGYEVYVVPKGAAVSDQYLVAALYAPSENGSERGVSMRWEETQKLFVEYGAARTATIIHPVIHVAGHLITTELHGGVEIPLVPGRRRARE